MTAALQFRDLTLGYDRHPAVHHLDGAIETGALVAVVGPNGAGKSTLFKGIVGLIKPLAGRIERGDVPAQNIAYLPQAAEIDRTFPINVYDMVAMGLWRRTGLLGGLDRDALRRADAAHAVRTAAAAGCPRDRARRAVQRGRRQDLGRPVRSGAALARRAAHGADRDARHRFRAGELARNPAARTPAGRVGPYLDRSHAGKPAGRAPHVRGLRRTCRPLRRRRTRACRNSLSPRLSGNRQRGPAVAVTRE